MDSVRGLARKFKICNGNQCFQSLSVRRVLAFSVFLIFISEFFSPLGKISGRAIYFTDVFSIF